MGTEGQVLKPEALFQSVTSASRKLPSPTPPHSDTRPKWGLWPLEPRTCLPLWSKLPLEARRLPQGKVSRQSGGQALGPGQSLQHLETPGL